MVVLAQSGTPIDVNLTNRLPETYPAWIPVDMRVIGTTCSTCAQIVDTLVGDVERAMRLLVPQATQPFAAPVHTTEERFGRVPKAYIVCLQDNTIPTPLQWRMLADIPCDEVMTLRTGHSPFLSAPDHLVAALDHLAVGACAT